MISNTADKHLNIVHNIVSKAQQDQYISYENYNNIMTEFDEYENERARILRKQCLC